MRNRTSPLSTPFTKRRSRILIIVATGAALLVTVGRLGRTGQPFSIDYRNSRLSFPRRRLQVQSTTLKACVPPMVAMGASVKSTGGL
jgi:hypothetical protein